MEGDERQEESEHASERALDRCQRTVHGGAPVSRLTGRERLASTAPNLPPTAARDIGVRAARGCGIAADPPWLRETRSSREGRHRCAVPPKA
jgi:hypothetical protein